MDDHNRFVLPHIANSEPQEDADEKQIDIVGNEIESGKSVSDELDGGCEPAPGE